MVHEVPDQMAFLRGVRAHLAPAGRLLVAEPRAHVRGAAFERTVAMAGAVGLTPSAAPAVRVSRAVILAAAPAR